MQEKTLSFILAFVEMEVLMFCLRLPLFGYCFLPSKLKSFYLCQIKRVLVSKLKATAPENPYGVLAELLLIMSSYFSTLL